MNAWWSDAGPDYCQFCEVSYYSECGYYCAGCDRPLCASCVVTDYAQRRVLCPECESDTVITSEAQNATKGKESGALKSKGDN